MGNNVAYWNKKKKTALLTIDNPPVNAFSSAVIEEMASCLAEIEADNDCAVLVITGAGDKAFMAGADIKEFPNYMGKPGAAKKFSLKLHCLLNKLEDFPIPTIVALNGMALGGGCELALACDVRIAGESCRMGLPEINLGIFPGGGGTQRLSRLVGEARAKEMIFTGDPVSAETAFNIGLVNRLTTDGEELASAMELADKISQKSVPALKLVKETINRGCQMQLKDGLKLEVDLFDAVFLTEDAQEGVNAFMEKRKPVFKGKY